MYQNISGNLNRVEPCNRTFQENSTNRRTVKKNLLKEAKPF